MVVVVVVVVAAAACSKRREAETNSVAGRAIEAARGREVAVRMPAATVSYGTLQSAYLSVLTVTADSGKCKRHDSYASNRPR
jgi:hypothetical protein